jgi:hypothetical protein
MDDPLDHGCDVGAPLVDTRPVDLRKRILGGHKTWRGLVSAVVVGTVVYELQRLAHAADVGTGAHAARLWPGASP